MSLCEAEPSFCHHIIPHFAGSCVVMCVGRGDGPVVSRAALEYHAGYAWAHGPREGLEAGGAGPDGEVASFPRVTGVLSI